MAHFALLASVHVLVEAVALEVGVLESKHGLLLRATRLELGLGQRRRLVVHFKRSAVVVVFLGKNYLLRRFVIHAVLDLILRLWNFQEVKITCPHTEQNFKMSNFVCNSDVRWN